MSAPPINVVAWRVGTGWSSVWHLEYTDAPGRTLCMRYVGAFATRERHGNDPTCEGCVAVLDHETAKRLRLEPTPNEYTGG